MHAQTTSTRITTAIAVAVVLFVAAVPAVAACCMTTSSRTTSMHMSMPCCEESCTLTRPAVDADREAALTAPRSIITFVAHTTMAPAVVNEREVIERRPLETAPPVLLLDRQLRI